MKISNTVFYCDLYGCQLQRVLTVMLCFCVVIVFMTTTHAFYVKHFLITSVAHFSISTSAFHDTGYNNSKNTMETMKVPENDLTVRMCFVSESVHMKAVTVHFSAFLILLCPALESPSPEARQVT